MQNGDDALRQFGTRIGLPNLKLGGDRTCSLTVGDGLELFFEGTDRDDELRLNGRVGDLHGADASVLRTLLVANYNGQATGAASLAIDPMSGEVMLGQRLAVGPMDAEGFASAVETFVKYLAFWTEHLPTMGGAKSAPAPVVMREEGILFRA